MLETATTAQPSMAASARMRVQGVWAQLRSMTSVEEDRSNWKDKTESESSLSEEDNGVFEGMMKTVFGSCTTGHFRQHPGLVPTSTRSSSMRQDRSFDHSPERKGGDDHARAAHVVHGMREPVEQRSRRHPRRVVQSPIENTALTKPFPVSSPKRHSSPLHLTPALVKEIPAPTSNGTFDDGISAISAYTLEEMARQEEELNRQANLLLPVRSDLTQETFEDVSADPKQSIERFAMTQKRSGDWGGLNMARGRSNGTHTSRTTKGTRSSRSSKDTKSTFESNWRRNEQKYWAEQVREENQMDMSPSRQVEMMKKGRRSRSRSGDLRKPVDATITTAGSSMHSGYSESPFSVKHPHDTFQFDAGDFFPSTETINANRQVQGSQYAEDPDRIVTDQEVLLLAQDSEFAEI